MAWPLAIVVPPPALPPPPFLSTWLFERPVAASTIVLGAVALCILAMRGRLTGRAAAGVAVAGVLLALALLAAGMLVETTRERLTRLTGELVDAVAAGRADAADGLLAERLYIDVGNALFAGGASTLDKNWALGQISQFGSARRLDDFTVSHRRAAVDSPTQGRTQARIIVRDTSWGAGSMWWELEWRRDPDTRWRVYSLELLRWNGQPVS